MGGEVTLRAYILTPAIQEASFHSSSALPFRSNASTYIRSADKTLHRQLDSLTALRCPCSRSRSYCPANFELSRILRSLFPILCARLHEVNTYHTRNYYR